MDHFDTVHIRSRILRAVVFVDLDSHKEVAEEEEEGRQRIEECLQLSSERCRSPPV